MFNTPVISDVRSLGQQSLPTKFALNSFLILFLYQKVVEIFHEIRIDLTRVVFPHKMIHQALKTLAHRVALDTQRMSFQLRNERGERAGWTFPRLCQAGRARGWAVADMLQDLHLQQHFLTCQMVEHFLVLRIVNFEGAVATEEGPVHFLHVLVCPVWQMFLQNVLHDVCPVLFSHPTEAAETVVQYLVQGGEVGLVVTHTSPPRKIFNFGTTNKTIGCADGPKSLIENTGTVLVIFIKVESSVKA